MLKVKKDQIFLIINHIITGGLGFGFGVLISKSGLDFCLLLGSIFYVST